MTDTAELFLGVIAAAVLLMALIQVGAIIAGLRLAKRVDRMADQLERDVKPLLANLANVATEAARAATLASAQIERFDKVFADLTQRVDQTLSAAQAFVAGPARQGMAVMTGVKAVVDAFRGLREASRRRRSTSRPAVDDEESLFIG